MPVRNTLFAIFWFTLSIITTQLSHGTTVALSWYMQYGLPVMARYGCLLWVPSLTKVLRSKLYCAQYRGILYRDVSSVYGSTLVKNWNHNNTTFWVPGVYYGIVLSLCHRVLLLLIKAKDPLIPSYIVLSCMLTHGMKPLSPLLALIVGIIVAIPSLKRQ